MRRTQIVAAAAAIFTFIGLGLQTAPNAHADPTTPGGNPAGTPTQSATKTVQVIRPDGSTPATNSESTLTAPTAYDTEYLKYTVTYALANSVNLGSLQLADVNDVVTAGYGTYVTSGANAPSLTATYPSDTSNHPAGTLTPSAVNVSGSPASLTVNIPTLQTMGGYTGIADGTYTLTYYVLLNNTIPQGLGDSSVTVPNGSSNPLGVAGGAMNQKNTVSVTATDNSNGSGTGAAVSNKDLGNTNAVNPSPGDPVATVNLLPKSVATYDATSAPGTGDPGAYDGTNALSITAGDTAKLVTTVKNTGNVPLDGTYTGNTDLGSVAAGKSVVEVTVNAGNTTGTNGALSATYDTGSVTGAAASNETSSGVTLTYSGVGLGASVDANYAASVNSSDTSGTQIWNSGVPAQPAGDLTVGTDKGDSNLTTTALTPTSAILIALKNNALPLIGGGAGVAVLAGFILVMKRRREDEEAFKTV